MTFKCEYCNKTFKRERTLAAHMCRNKKRFLQRDEQHVKLGLKFFNDWYRIAMGQSSPKNYITFMKSQYYSAFVRFGLYVLETRVLAPERYLEWLIKEQTSVDAWCKDSIYNRYLAEHTKKETVERALERFVLHADKWSEKSGRHWTEYWECAGQNRILFDIKMGKISPWIILGYPPARSVLEEFPDGVLNEIAETLDLEYWNRKLDLNKQTVEWIQEMLN